MNKKKVVSLLIAGALAIGVVGGTFALFTSTDSVTNKFSTGSTTDPGNPDGGIDVEENFPNPGDVFPGMNMTKEVWVNSTASYDQILRAKLEKVWKDADDNIITHYVVTEETVKDDQGNDIVKENITYIKKGEAVPTEAVPLNLNRIRLNFANFGTGNGDTWAAADGGLTAPEYGWYYYNQVFVPGATTSHLLKSVDFVSADDDATITDKDNYYKNLKFDVIVKAEAVQLEGASVGNEHTGWENTPDYVYPVTP